MANSSALRRPRTILRSLENIEAVLIGIHELLTELLTQEVEMAAEQSAEAQALQDAIDRVTVEVQNTENVDGEVAAELGQVVELLPKLGATSPAQVNAVTALADRLHGLTVKLKGGVETASAATSAAEEGTETAAEEAAEDVPPAAAESPANTTESSAPAAAEPPAAAAGGAQGVSPQALYTFDASVSGAVEDPAQFTASGLRVSQGESPSLAPLFHFNGDPADGSAANGVSVPGYVRFTGTPEAVPAG